MKATGKTRKQRSAEARPAKGCCGTLSYIAECRGIIKNRRPHGSRVDVIGRVERNS